MTCIIGVRCKDGVLLAGDTKVVRGSDISSEYKIFRHAGLEIVYGCSGATALVDTLIEEIDIALNKTANDEPIIKTWRDFKFALEDIMEWLFKRYNQRDPSIFIDVFVGYKPTNMPAQLWHFYPHGISEEIKGFEIIGSGKPYAMPFIKSLYRSEITLQEMTIVSCYTLGLLNEIQVDYSVGGYPQIVWLKDNKKNKREKYIIQLDDQSILKILDSLRPENGGLADQLWRLFTFNQEK